jgi:signal transduction histidine kinase
MKKEGLKGYAFICDAEGIIQDIIVDNLETDTPPAPGKGLVSLVVPEETGKCLNFLREIKNKRLVFDWELVISSKGELVPVYFFGGEFNGGIFVGAAKKRESADTFYEEFMRINNEQTNTLRTVHKEQHENENLYYELAKLNNELVNLQRDLYKKNQELERLNEIKNQFIGMTAHDLRNPLGSFSSICSLLLDEDFSSLDTEQRQLIEEMEKYAKHMLSMVNDLLDITTIESGKMNLKFQKGDISDFTEHAVNIHKPLAERKNISLIYENKIGRFEIDFDHEKIQQVIANLITNAIKFSYSGSHIKTTAAPAVSGVKISVADEGQGIPENELSKLFRPYGRTSTRSTEGEPSTGLGLAISRRIVEAHGGTIKAQSRVGKGSVFSFIIPEKTESETAGSA